LEGFDIAGDIEEGEREETAGFRKEGSYKGIKGIGGGEMARGYEGGCG
jgi:hypothetical protein